jgi:hypothetical protein
MTVTAITLERPKILLETDGLKVTDSATVDGEFGVHTKKSYRKGQILFTITGPILPARTKYSFSVDIDKHIEPLRADGSPDFGYYSNHSCDPTAFVRVVCKKDALPYIEVIARRNLKAGEELTFDYASFEYEITIQGEKCMCNASVCRGKIHGFKHLPQPIREQYKKEGIIPEHLLTFAAGTK